jgi:hypothetical protein
MLRCSIVLDRTISLDMFRGYETSIFLVKLSSDPFFPSFGARMGEGSRSTSDTSQYSSDWNVLHDRFCSSTVYETLVGGSCLCGRILHCRLQWLPRRSDARAKEHLNRTSEIFRNVLRCVDEVGHSGTRCDSVTTHSDAFLSFPTLKVFLPHNEGKGDTQEDTSYGGTP